MFLIYESRVFWTSDPRRKPSLFHLFQFVCSSNIQSLNSVSIYPCICHSVKNLSKYATKLLDLVQVHLYKGFRGTS